MIEHLSFLLTVEFVASVFVLIGLYAVAWWLIDNLKSITQIILSILLPYFQPQEDLPLSEKYGTWAGKVDCTTFNCIYWHTFTSTMVAMGQC